MITAIFKQVRARLFRYYDLRISTLEAISIQLQEQVQRLAQQLQATQDEKFKLEGRVNHIEHFYGAANNELANEISELRREIKQLREQPFGQSRTIDSASQIDNTLYVKRFTSSLASTTEQKS